MSREKKSKKSRTDLLDENLNSSNLSFYQRTRVDKHKSHRVKSAATRMNVQERIDNAKKTIKEDKTKLEI
mgnify:CR=1 FL=1